MIQRNYYFLSKYISITKTEIGKVIQYISDATDTTRSTKMTNKKAKTQKVKGKVNGQACSRSMHMHACR